ncbi:uncharacterized protein LOC134248947 [Saccostrea cucullata]|uniref:uncharacterized protein LOC134248947 n=1 Tax=Saccostrea cuccullata TaxID=36930 RepID=UPI002ED4F519
MNIGPLNTPNSSFLYIGSKASLRITLNPSRGYYENLVIFVKTPGENIDVALSDFRHVGNMEYEVRYAFLPRYDSTAFQRQKGCGYKLIRTFVYYSNYSENQLICDFFVYLHNAKSLEDKQNVSTNAEISYTQNGIEKTCPTHFVNWTVRTSFLVQWLRTI